MMHAGLELGLRVRVRAYGYGCVRLVEAERRHPACDYRDDADSAGVTRQLVFHLCSSENELRGSKQNRVVQCQNKML